MATEYEIKACHAFTFLRGAVSQNQTRSYPWCSTGDPVLKELVLEAVSDTPTGGNFATTFSQADALPAPI